MMLYPTWANLKRDIESFVGRDQQQYSVCSSMGKQLSPRMLVGKWGYLELEENIQCSIEKWKEEKKNI